MERDESEVVATFCDSVYFKSGYFFNCMEELKINPIFELLSLRAINNIPDMLGYL